MKLPLVSILIPVYNRRNLLIPCIESALAQTFTDFELVIVDNASTDGAWEVCQKYAKQDSRVKIFRNEANVGPGFNGLRCLMEAKGFYVKTLFSDDLIKPDFLEKTIPLIENNPDVGFVFTGAEIGREPGTGTIHYIVGDKTHIFPSQDFIYYSFFRQGQIVPNSPGAGLFRLADVRQNVLMKIPSPTMHDYHEHGMGVDIIQYLVTAHKYLFVAHVPEALAFFRGHEDSETMNSIATRPDKWRFGYQQAKIWFASHYNYSQELKCLLVHQWITSFFQTRQWISLSETCRQYLHNPPEIPVIDNRNEQFASDLKIARQYLAEFWLNAPLHLLDALCSESNSLIHVHNLLINVKTNDLLNDDEEYFVGQLINEFDQINLKNNPTETIRLILALMLYFYPYQIWDIEQLDLIPSYPNFGIAFVNFLLSSPLHFEKLGEVDKYSEYFIKVIKYLHDLIFQLPEEQAKNLGLTFINHNYLNFVKLQLTENNLKQTYVYRQNIIEFTLKKVLNTNINNDFVFHNRPKIRLGILLEKSTILQTFISLNDLDKKIFDIVLLTIKSNNTEPKNFIENFADQCIQLPESFLAKIQTIQNQDLDILLIGEDLTTTINNIVLLCFYRLARIQIALPFSPVTTGINNVDYYLSHELVKGKEYLQSQYIEKLLTIEGISFYGLPDLENSVNLTRKTLGIAPNTVIFLSVISLSHLTPELLADWAKILIEVPYSVIVLSIFIESNTKNIQNDEFFIDLFKRKIFLYLAKYEINPQRFILLFKENYNYLQELFRLSDIYLNSYGISHPLQIYRAMYVGIPAISLTTYQTSHSECGANILRQLGIPELIAETRTDYIQLAVNLGLNQKLRQEKQEKIKQKMREKPYFLDSNIYCQKIQELLIDTWQNYLSQQLTDQFKLQEINLIVFPDWSQPEEVIFAELTEVFQIISNHPNQNNITLLIDNSNIAGEEADLMLSSVLMNLMMEEEIDVTETLEIVLIGELSDLQWQVLIPKLTARIILESENQEKVLQVGANHLTNRQILDLLSDNLSN